jgi:hypothetical protein
MLALMFDPKLYLLMAAAYLVGFVNSDDPSGRRDWWETLSDVAFWGAVVLAGALFVVHGSVGGLSSVACAWAFAIVGARRGILAERNLLWETALWTMPLDRIIAMSREPAAPEIRPVRRPSQIRTIEWQLPTLADVLPCRGRRLTIMGIALDMAACLVFMSALSVLLR